MYQEFRLTENVLEIAYEETLTNLHKMSLWNQKFIKKMAKFEFKNIDFSQLPEVIHKF